MKSWACLCTHRIRQVSQRQSKELTSRHKSIKRKKSQECVETTWSSSKLKISTSKTPRYAQSAIVCLHKSRTCHAKSTLTITTWSREKLPSMWWPTSDRTTMMARNERPKYFISILSRNGHEGMTLLMMNVYTSFFFRFLFIYMNYHSTCVYFKSIVY